MLGLPVYAGMAAHHSGVNYSHVARFNQVLLVEHGYLNFDGFKMEIVGKFVTHVTLIMQ